MFLDTSGLFRMHHADEPGSEEAVEMFEAADSKLTQSYVLSELVALSRTRGVSRSQTLVFVRALTLHPEVEIVWVDAALNDAALSLLEARPDKGYSLCDAVSFVLMKRHAMLDALTTDRHFEQEGFVRLLN